MEIVLASAEVTYETLCRVAGGCRYFLFLFYAAACSAQADKIVIPAGTPEDHDLQAITNEQDAAKKLAMYQDFVQKYASNPAAVAYGNWQISQAYRPRVT